VDLKPANERLLSLKVRAVKVLSKDPSTGYTVSHSRVSNHYSLKPLEKTLAREVNFISARRVSSSKFACSRRLMVGNVRVII